MSLFFACSRGHVQQVALLLSPPFGLVPDAPEEWNGGYSPLMSECRSPALLCVPMDTLPFALPRVIRPA